MRVCVCVCVCVGLRQSVWATVCEGEGRTREKSGISRQRTRERGNMGASGGGEREGVSDEGREGATERERMWACDGVSEKGKDSGGEGEKEGENNLVWPYFSMAFPFFIFPHCCHIYTGIKDYWKDPRRGNKEEGKGGERKINKRKNEGKEAGGIQEKKIWGLQLTIIFIVYQSANYFLHYSNYQVVYLMPNNCEKMSHGNNVPCDVFKYLAFSNSHQRNIK